MTMVVHHPKAVLRLGQALFSGLPVPVDRLRKVSRHAMTGLEQSGQVVLCQRVTL